MSELTLIERRITDRNVLARFSKNRLARVITVLSQERKDRYKRYPGPKYGSINRGFREPEINALFNHIKNSKAKLSCYIMQYLGTRISEVVKISIAKGDDPRKRNYLDLENRKLYLWTLKSQQPDVLHLHQAIYDILCKWVEEHQAAIIAHGGYILWSGPYSRTGHPHVSPNWLRKEFREARSAAALGYSYDKSRNGRPLYRLTTHSLRHTFITNVYRSCRDPKITQRLARHKDFDSTGTYIHVLPEELDATMERAFSSTEQEPSFSPHR